MVGLVVTKIYVALAIFLSYYDLEAGGIQLWNRNVETRNRTPDLLLRKPGA